jgi:sugar (pentulose or hexulose) kinase
MLFLADFACGRKIRWQTLSDYLAFRLTGKSGVSASSNSGKNLAILTEMGLAVQVVRVLHVMHRQRASDL